MSNENMPKLVISDLDDTFLTHEKEITPANRELLDKFTELGIQFVPCSGRPFSGIPEELLVLDCVKYAVSANGGVITDAKTREKVATWHISVEQVKRLYAAVKDMDVTFDVFIDGQAYSEAARYAHLHEFAIHPAQVAFLRSNRVQVDMTIPELVDEMSEKAGKPIGIERMSTHYKNDEVRELVCEIVDADPSIHWASSGRANIEINHIDASKGNALRWICETEGIDIANTIAFGDNLNDCSMLEAAGDGVCMANGTDEAKAVANHTTLSCEESGVAAYMNKLLGL